MPKFRILQICKKTPYPAKDGESIAIHTIGKGFLELGQELEVLAISTEKHPFLLEKLPSELSAQAHYHSVFVDTSLRPWDAFCNLWTSKSYNIERFDSPELHQRLAEILQARSFDIIQLEGLYLAPYIPTLRKYSQALLVMRSHNVEAEIWQRLGQQEKNPIKAWYLRLLAKRLANYEQQKLTDYDALVPISEKDADFFREAGCTCPLLTIPTAVDSEKLQIDKSKIQWPSLFHIGALDWMPNQEGLLWFLREVWPKLREAYPELRFFLAGRNTPEQFFQLNIPGLEVLGEVEDAVEFMNSKAIMVVPLHSGSGMRIKIIEALALGKTVVSTSIGLEGIGARHGQELLVADTAQEFAQALLSCLGNKSYSEGLGRAACNYVREYYDNKKLSAKLLDFYQQQVQYSESKP